VTLAPLTQAAEYIERGTLVRLLPVWHADVDRQHGLRERFTA
jgi:hypothetical protein